MLDVTLDVTVLTGTGLSCLNIELGSCYNYIHSSPMLLGTPNIYLIMQISNRPVKVH